LEKKLADRSSRALQSSTVERVLQDGGALELEEGGKRQLTHQSIIDRLKQRHKLTIRQFNAGDMLRTDTEKSMAEGVVDAVSFGAGGQRRTDSGLARVTAFVTAESLDARRRYRAAREAVGERLWPILAECVLIQPPGTRLSHVGAVLYGRAENKMAESAALENLRLALDVLADHYYGKPAETQRGRRYVWHCGT